MKKIMVLVLAAMMLLACCSASAETPEGYPEVKDIDFGGATIYISPYWDPPARSDEPTADQQLEYDYKDWLMEKFNVTVVEEQVGGWGDSQVEEIGNFISTADGTEYRFFIMPPGFVGSLVAQNRFATWANNDLIDLKGDNFNLSIVDFMTKGNDVYGVAYGKPEPRTIVYFNKKVLEQAGIDWNEIYDMQMNGTWTWDKFEELCAKITKDNDADGVNDVFGLTGNTNDLYNGAVFGNGGSFFGYDDNGKLIVTAGTDNVTEGLTWAVSLWNNYARTQTPEEQESNIWNFYIDAFKAGNVGFSVYQAYSGYNEGNYEMKDMSDDWGAVMFPKGPKCDDDRYHFVVSDNVIVLPAVYDEETTKNLEYFLTLWYQTPPGVDEESAWIGSKYENCSDERAVDETYAMMREDGAGRSDLSLLLGDNNKILGSSTYGNYLWGMTWNDPQALYESIKPTWDALCAVFNGDMTQDDFDKMLEEKAAEEAAAAEETKAE